MKDFSLNSGNNFSYLESDEGDGSRKDVDRSTKKFILKMVMNDKLLGFNFGVRDKTELGSPSAYVDEEIEFLDGDIHRSIVNGIPAIDFLEMIQILYKEMELTVVVKLLGRNIGYAALNNRIRSLWNPSKPFHLMDIENGYYLAKFQYVADYNKVFSQGPWLIYGQYLTVQP
ncbi:hypothetical protein J1N35_018225 [Gossypium stocksii]|uniref:DUF4283 domain-containing protein n=1 Tax=Gossypium stocksii TaxID=47602 RepID=A0A9D4A6G8_9ROSI|nr:hypothetical protein J1N35_018225 [Gossypium stocksii]